MPTPSTIFLGFRLFQNILGQWQYMRISDANSTTLMQDLTPYDTEIVVADASKLTQPDIANRIPGVIFIGAERIIYWQVNGNKLSQLLRGTVGTPWGETYPTGTVVRDAGQDQAFPFAQWNWVATPSGLALDNGTLGTFLRDEQGTYNFQ
jgi:hypothetical protein